MASSIGATRPRINQRMTQARDRERQLLELMKAGVTRRDELARQVDPPYANASAVSNALARIRERSLKLIFDDYTELRNLEVLRLDDLQRRTTEIMLRPPPLLHRGDAVLGTDGRPIPNARVQLDAIRTLVDVIDRRARLLGLYAPDRLETSGPGGGPVQVEHIEAVHRRLHDRFVQAHAVTVTAETRDT